MFFYIIESIESNNAFNLKGNETMNKVKLLNACKTTLTKTNMLKVFSYLCYALKVNINDKVDLLELAEQLLDNEKDIAYCVNNTYKNLNYANGLTGVYNEIINHY